MRYAALALLLLPACASEPRNDFVALSYEAADRLTRDARRELGRDDTIIYGVFTPAGQPSASSAFGRMFADHMASRLSQNGVKVVEVRLREAIAVRQGGPYALSDDVRDVARRVRATAVLAGTYATTPEYVMLSARLLDVENGFLISSWDKRAPLGRADWHLFDRGTSPWGLGHHVLVR